MDKDLIQNIHKYLVRGAILQILGYIGILIPQILVFTESFKIFLSPFSMVVDRYTFFTIMTSSFLLGQLILLTGLLEWVRGSKHLSIYFDRFRYLSIGRKILFLGVIFNAPLAIGGLLFKAGLFNGYDNVYQANPSLSLGETLVILMFFSGVIGLILISIGYIIYTIFLYEFSSEFPEHRKLKYGSVTLLVGSVLSLILTFNPIGGILTIAGLSIITLGINELTNKISRLGNTSELIYS